MDFGQAIEGLQYGAIVVAALAGFVVGALWFAPFAFGKAWQKEVGITDADAQSANMPMIFGLSFILSIIMAFALRLVQVEPGLIPGMTAGLVAGIGFVSTAICMNMLFERRSGRLMAITCGHHIASLVVMGAILGAWP